MLFGVLEHCQREGFGVEDLAVGVHPEADEGVEDGSEH